MTIRVLWYVATALVAWSFGYAVVRGSDLWWHLADGRWIWDHGTVPLADPWSFTRHGGPWVNDAWLSDLVFHVWTLPAGVPALAWWKWSVVVATFVLLFRLVWRLGGDPISSWLAVLLGVAVAAPLLDLRPHLYSLLAYVVLLSVTLGRAHPSFLLPLLFLVWANLHAMVVFGGVALAILLAPAIVRWGRDGRRTLAIGAASAVACLLNPNGLTIVSRPLRYALSGSPFGTIVEWLPAFVPGGIQAPLYPWAVAAFVVAVALVLVRRDRTVSPVGIVLGALTLAMSLRSRRFIPLFAISQTIVVGPALARILPAPPRAVAIAAPLIATLLGVVWLAPYPQVSWAFAYLTAEDTFPVETCTFLDANGIGGRVFAYYGWGGYLHARTAGRVQVFIDGRADMVFDDETYRRYTQVAALAPGWMEIVESSGAEYVLWPRDQPALIDALVRSGRWRALYEDHVSALLQRADRPVPQDLRPTPDSPYRRLVLADQAVAQHGFAEAEHQLGASLALDPHLGAACRMLARVQALRGSPDALATAARCQRTYPFPAERDAFAKFHERLEGVAPGR